MILSLTLFAVGVFCYAISQLIMHGKIRFKSSFWEIVSWKNKWKWSSWLPFDAPDNWYYRLFKLEYKERFPLSATALVFLTDGYHLCQFFYIKLFILSIVLYSPVFGWYWDGAIYLGCWYAVFNLIYKVFSK